MKPRVPCPFAWPALLLAALLALPARADVIHYKDGRQVEGRIVARTASELTLETDFGTIKVALSKVARIEERATPREALAARRKALRDDDAEGLFLLALEARDAGLQPESLGLLREVVAAAPQHRLANELLGRVEVDGRWMDPAEVEAWVASLAAAKEAEGLMWDGGAWRPIPEVMARRGFVRWKDAWRPRRAALAEQAVEEAPAALGVPLQAVEGARLTLLSPLDPADATDLLQELEAMLDGVAARLALPAEDVQRAFAGGIPVYLLPGTGPLQAFLDGDFARRHGVPQAVIDSYRDAWGFFVDVPQPLVVLNTQGEHIAVVRDDALAIRSFLGNQLGVLAVRLLMKPRPVPAWLQAAVAAEAEGRLNDYATLTITSFALDDEGRPVDPFVDGWESFEQFERQFAGGGGHATLPPLRLLLRRPAARLDSRDVGMAWNFLLYLAESRPTSLEEYVRRYGTDAVEGGDAALRHEAAYAAAFDLPVEDLEREWHSWARARGARLGYDRGR